MSNLSFASAQAISFSEALFPFLYFGEINGTLVKVTGHHEAFATL